jgi:pilus assembly protein CpaF
MVEVKSSGPLRLAFFRGTGDEKIDDAGCRKRVIEALQHEAEVDWVVLDGPITRVYRSKKLYRAARAVALAKRLALDDRASAKRKGCSECIRRRRTYLLQRVSDLASDPARYIEILQFGENCTKLFKECKECLPNFRQLLSQIEKLFDSLELVNGKPYSEMFEECWKPFFVDGLWLDPPADSKVIDKYELRNGRGTVRIRERTDNPVLFYELDLPEFKIPYGELELLYSAFNVKVDNPPATVDFASLGSARIFTEEWYTVLLHSLRDEGDGISSARIHELSRMITNWMMYRLLEPFSHDDNITDIYVHAPPEMQPVMVEHERWGILETGIYWDTASMMALGEAVASRLGTSFDEVRPQLDAEIPELGMRLFMSRAPAIWPRSVEMMVRKRRRTPWTQPLFLFRRTLTPLASAYLSNMLRIGCSAFIIGEVGAAKTSQVETYIPEIGLQNRIITFQDTQELHIDDFLAHGYRISDVRIQNPDHLEKQIRIFLRAGQSYWLVTEVRAPESVRSVLGAAVRQGTQPVIASFHARDKQEAFSLISNIMSLPSETFKHIDVIVSTARFQTPQGIIRRVIEISEVGKEWRETPEYVEIFMDDRRSDSLVLVNLLEGPKKLIGQWSSMDVSRIDLKSYRKIDFLPPERGGSSQIPRLCRKLGMDQCELLLSILAEAKVKSTLLLAAQRSGNTEYLELPFVTKAYAKYFSILRKESDQISAFEKWRKCLPEL